MLLHFSPMYFKWNALVCDHEEGAVGFPECKPLSRSSTNYTDSDSTLCIIKPPQAWLCQYVESHQMSKAFSFRRYIEIRPGHTNYPSPLWASPTISLAVYFAMRFADLPQVHLYNFEWRGYV